MRAGLLIVVAVAACSDASDEPVCSSGRIVGTSEGVDMTPGQKCNECHAFTNAGGAGDNEAPIYAFAGTVYVSSHEPDNCAGGPLGAAPDDEPPVVEVVDATGMRYSASVTGAGNFMLEDVVLAFPITARVRYQGRTAWMVQPATTGECNSCHTVDGAENAAGRIRLP